ncbi:MAG: phasin family protein [Zoogloeaceae bacterium]|jgi:phasin family protein|nr:phasin family protein [Zoogloeaceae bacterium]
MNTPNFEQLSAAQKISADALLPLIRSTCNGAERLTAINVAAARDFLSDVVTSAQQLLAIRDASEFTRANVSLFQPLLEKSMNYVRDVYEVATAFQKDVTAIAEGQYEQISRNAAATLVDKTSDAPGSDVVAATVKTLLDASSRFFDRINDFSQQANAITEANFKALSATTQAATAATRKSVKK